MPYAAHDPVPDEERIGDRDLAEWHTRTGQRFVALVERVVALLARGWQWSLANLALVLTVLVGGGIVLGATVLASRSTRRSSTARDWPRSTSLLDAAVASRTPASEEWVTRFTDLGGTVGLPLIAVAVVVVRRGAPAVVAAVILMGVAAAGSVAITVIGKDLRAGAAAPGPRGRPVRTSASFPFGHTLNATVVLASRRTSSCSAQAPAQPAAVGSLVVVFVVAMGRPGLARSPLAHRRDGQLARRARLARHRRDGRPGQGHPRPGRAHGDDCDDTSTRPAPGASRRAGPPDAVPDTAARAASSRAIGTR